MKYINRIILLIAVVFATTLQAQTKTFNSQVRVKQVPLSSSLDSLVTINSSGLLTYLPKSELVTEAQTLSFSNGQLTISDANTIDLDTYYYSQTDVDGLISSSAGALEFITEGGNTGIAIKGRNPANYGDIGEGAVDLSFSSVVSNFNGANGDYSLVVGINNTGTRGSLVSGNANSGGIYSVVGGEFNNAGFVASSFGVSNFAPSYAETSIGLYGTDYTPNNTSSYNANDRVFNVGNGTGVSGRSDAFTVYKIGNATLNGDLTVDNIIGDGSQLTNVNASTLNGLSDYLRDENIVNADASINALSKESISLYQNTTGSTNFPKPFGGSVLFNMENSYQRTFSIWKDFNDARWYLFDYNSNRTLKSSNEIYHGGNSAPTKTINTSTLQTSATLNSAFPFADNPDGTIVVNKDTTQPYIYIRSNSTTWRQVTTSDISGIVPNSDNWDNIRVTGNYTSTFNVTVGTPVNAGSMAMTHIQTSSDSASQQAIRVTSSETWIRTLFQGTWSAWMKLTMI